MKTILFAPAIFNLAETTRMIEIAKSLRTEHHCIFFGYSETYASMIRDAGFQLLLLKPALTPKLEKQIMDFDQAKRLKNPFDYHLVKERVLSELQFIKKLSPSVIVTGSNVTVFLSARISEIPLVYVKPIALSRPYFENVDEVYLPRQLAKKWLPKNQIWHLLQRLALQITYQSREFKKTAKDFDVNLPPYLIDLFDGDLNLITTPEIFMEYYLMIRPIFA